MPSVSEKQRRFMGADYARAKHGETTVTGMNLQNLREFASGVTTNGRYDGAEKRKRKRKARRGFGFGK